MKPFRNGARVCFVGDSITHQGVFIKHIVAHYRKHIPEVNIEFYNCGIAGGNLGNTIRIFEEDIAVYDPTHIVLMIGVNDSRRGYLGTPPSMERYEILFGAYRNYGLNLERFYRLMQERQIELILCTPMPYAEYMESDETPLRGGYALMQGYAAYIRKFAAQYGLDLCDYHAVITEAMQVEILYGADRIHPNSLGHERMAKTFLAAQGFAFEPTAEFSKEIEAWDHVTQKIRNLITTEFLTVPNYADLSDAERLAVVRQHAVDLERGTYNPGAYCASLTKAYLQEKPRQAAYIAKVKEMMKK